jgi:hypothetical protein
MVAIPVYQLISQLQTQVRPKKPIFLNYKSGLVSQCIILCNTVILLTQKNEIDLRHMLDGRMLVQEYLKRIL